MNKKSKYQKKQIRKQMRNISKDINDPNQGFHLESINVDPIYLSKSN